MFLTHLAGLTWPKKMLHRSQKSPSFQKRSSKSEPRSATRSIGLFPDPRTLRIPTRSFQTRCRDVLQVPPTEPAAPLPSGPSFNPAPARKQRDPFDQVLKPNRQARSHAGFHGAVPFGAKRIGLGCGLGVGRFRCRSVFGFNKRPKG